MIPSAHSPLRCRDMVEGDLPEYFTISSKSTEIMIKYEQDLSFSECTRRCDDFWILTWNIERII